LPFSFSVLVISSALYLLLVLFGIGDAAEAVVGRSAESDKLFYRYISGGGVVLVNYRDLLREIFQLYLQNFPAAEYYAAALRL